MKVSDFIVRFLEEKGVTDVFGFQGTMIAHFVDSVGKSEKLTNHSVYNEQAAAFAACGYTKATGKVAVAYATSGPGAVNLLSGIADAYCDSVPVLFITGQVNTTEYTEVAELRQQSFQQVDVVNIVKPVVKYATMVTDAEKIAEELYKAWNIACEGRKGPVVLDIPMNIQRGEISEETIQLAKTAAEKKATASVGVASLKELMRDAKRPVFILGNGIGKTDEDRMRVRQLIRKIGIPVITTLLGRDIPDFEDALNFGVIGAAYGHRYANWIAYQKADLIISLGASLCRRQVGGNSLNFAPNARIIRVDIDEVELKRIVHPDEEQILADVNEVVKVWLTQEFDRDYSEWVSQCELIRNKMTAFDEQCEERMPNKLMEYISTLVGKDDVVACDVGQHMMWTMQSLEVKESRLLFSGGHGAMGFALPAAIGAYYGKNNDGKVFCIAGDGAFQMNIQELQWVVREEIPVCMIVLNNSCLGLIRQQQEDFFDSKFYGALEMGGYTAPNFAAIGKAYGIETYRLQVGETIPKDVCEKIGKKPILLEMVLPDSTLAMPKTYFGQSVLNQKPYISQELFREIEKI